MQDFKGHIFEHTLYLLCSCIIWLVEPELLHIVTTKKACNTENLAIKVFRNVKK